MLKPIETWISEWLTSSGKLHSCYISTTQHTLWIPTGYACVIPRTLCLFLYRLPLMVSGGMEKTREY